MTDATVLPGPVQPDERVHLLDVLRGFALWGILWVNHQNVSGTTWNLIDFFAAGSFYTSFSFLFGLGFAMQLIRAEKTGKPFALRYAWRALLLLGIGIVHYVYVRTNDILIIYALCGIPLLLVRRLRPTAVLAIAAAVFMIYTGPRVLEGNRVDPEQIATRTLDELGRRAASASSPPAWCQVPPGITERYRAEVCGKAASARLILTNVWTVRWWRGHAIYVFMMLLGLYAARTRVLSEAARHTRLLIAVTSVGLVLGLTGNAFDVFGEPLGEAGIALPPALDRWNLSYALGNAGLALFYLSAIALLFTHAPRARRLLSPLANVGRMGLTNFVLQDFIILTILGHRGLGLINGLEGWQSLVAINLVFVAQILYSNLWFRYFRMGPLESLWRSLTWFRWQPIRARPMPIAAV